jgi:hypothetical protein
LIALRFRRIPVRVLPFPMIEYAAAAVAEFRVKLLAPKPPPMYPIAIGVLETCALAATMNRIRLISFFISCS